MAPERTKLCDFRCFADEQQAQIEPVTVVSQCSPCAETAQPLCCVSHHIVDLEHHRIVLDVAEGLA